MSNTSNYLHRKLARRLIPIFVAWKCCLLLLAAFSPGPGYDTSSLILLNTSANRHDELQSLSRCERFALRIFRWDALYFVKSAQRGYVHEQEWAFSWAYSYLVNTSAKQLARTSDPSLQHHIWAGVAISNVGHFLSVLALFRLLNVALGPHQDGRVPFIASILHILSPAALFLSSPYTEAIFSMLNFTGMLHYTLTRSTANANRTWTVYQDAYMLSSGILFACATSMRGNGLLSGLIYLYDVASLLPQILTLQLSRHEARRLFATCLAGLTLAIGFVGPQYLAYQEYCVAGTANVVVRPWCKRTIPSIYSWVQSTYWNVGFLRYWTLSNLPLFLIAAPMMWLLVKSSVTVLRDRLHRPPTSPTVSQAATPAGLTPTDTRLCVLPQLALPELALAIAAATSFHVQIINRLSSGYPIWYLTIAEHVMAETKTGTKNSGLSKWLVRGMILYCMVQGVLYASFLPPA
ncbi:glycosyltransferase family 76 protein [Pleomassaria siparia CBS 279.74]|uniref:GPI mannosyltransferase 2 n=1 Tax=Pleomassaria siparia CBS 279.74 TaxID=1314801 RepID=A0A6G1K3Q7_9PLEO|nr:glycosyltransferase family 76 protein [Pleomassaria siparia CBS 279.74]